MSHLTRITILLAVFFGLDKVLAFIRQIIIARQFGLSLELDAFNVANNIPDLLFALISGGALAVAFIPVLSEVIVKEGHTASWDLFSRIANLAFIVTAILAVLVALASNPLVSWELGIAPGFEQAQQELVAELMRLNLIATLIFSISGLVMAGLQANQHFLLPAMAPALYNIGQIFGAVILAPEQGYQILGITLPAFGLGVHGLVYGVILGAVLHLGIQIPGLIRYKFHWIPSLGLKTDSVQKVLKLMLPRLATMFSVQLIFLVRDNLASRLQEGAVTALSYGWMIQQVPETLIGTAIGTALLPTISEYFSKNDQEKFQTTIQRAGQILIAILLPTAVILGTGLRPLLQLAFGFDSQGTDLLLWVTRAYLAGLVGQSLLEVASRAFYSQQNARIPLLAALLNLVIYIVFGSQLYRPLGAAGISLSDSLAFTVQGIFLFLLLNRKVIKPFRFGNTLVKSLLAAATGGAVTALVLYYGSAYSPLGAALLGMILGVLAVIPFIRKELSLVFHL